MIGHAPSLEDCLRLDEAEVQERLGRARQELDASTVILGHHYQADDVIRFADVTGDSFRLARDGAARRDARYIVFLGVHFMAESARILAAPEQRVILPDLTAGCSMADMAALDDVEVCWDMLRARAGDVFTPITYMNSTAAIKAFCGARGGAVCTSSNAARIFRDALGRKPRLLFLPDQHLGRNTAFDLGIPLPDMAVWDPRAPGASLAAGADQARVVLWKGHCSVHMKFRPEDVDAVRRRHPGIRVIAHPECTFEVVRKADASGSTERIVETVARAAPGSAFAIGTEIHLVSRLAAAHPDRLVISLSGISCLCSTMYRIDPPHLLHVLENLVAGRVVNEILVPPDVARDARVALDRMLAIAA